MPENFIIIFYIAALADLFGIFLALSSLVEQIKKITLFLDMLLEEAKDK